MEDVQSEVGMVDNAATPLRIHHHSSLSLSTGTVTLAQTQPLLQQINLLSRQLRIYCPGHARPAVRAAVALCVNHWQCRP